ncbi:MAG: hypothetical protein GC160_14795 [Acidobacteria bacterium]|nr:hypothetical protein [Acidobacteriota bacterium]
MFRLGLALLTVAGLAMLGGCASSGPPTEAEALAAVQAHLGKRTDLNFGEMGLKVESVTGDGERATASVGFTLAGQTEPAMKMDYQLRREESGWVVEAPGGGAGHGGAQQVAPPPMGGGGGLPPNHPPVGTEPQQQKLPPNHPPVGQ